MTMTAHGSSAPEAQRVAQAQQSGERFSPPVPEGFALPELPPVSAASPAAAFAPVPRRAVNVAQFLRQTAARLPEHPAVIAGGTSAGGETALSWAEVDERASALAAALLAGRTRRRDTVMLVADNCPDVVTAFWGILRAGGVIAPPNAKLSVEELLGIAEEVRPAAVLADAAHAEFVTALRETGWDGDVLTVGEFDSLPAAPQQTDAPVDEDDPCWYFFTSGSTGRPKAAVFTHRHLAAVLANHHGDLFPDEGEDGASLVIAPLSHGAGIHMLAQVFTGCASVLVPGPGFDAGLAWELIDRHGVTNAFTVPTILNRLVQAYPTDRGPEDHTLRYVVYAGAPMLATDQAAALERLGQCLVQYFGLAEVTGSITVLRRHEHGRIPADAAGIGTCGRARTGVVVSIRDESGRELPAGEQGEVCVSGPTVCAGYLGRPEANAESFAHGVFHTGDVGYLDARGYLFLTGRKSDMFISGGSNVYPREVEEAIQTFPGVSQTCVVGVPDPDWGEMGVAVVELESGAPGRTGAPGTEASATQSASEAAAQPSLEAAAQPELAARLRAHLKERLAAYKVPKEYVFVAQMPVTAYGKIARKELRAELSAGRGRAR
ncbi:AMP-binding protein [Brevibacterium album]|uniref:AMP-binding protein n=1 Tax=Brevibacterium album TaxID=417948 RepID=UPI0004256888|nr:AMP-binding protein [Brevibacterium album]